jgi:acetyltransferase
MLTLCEKLGFTRKYLEDEEVFEVTLPLGQPTKPSH